LSPEEAQWQLSKARGIFQDFYRSYPHLRGSEGEPLENAIEQITTSFTELHQTLQHTIDNLDNEGQRAVSLEKQLKTKREEVQARNTKIHNTGQELTKALAFNQHNYTQYMNDRASLEQKRASLQQRFDKLLHDNTSLQSFKNTYENELHKAKGDAQTESQSARERHQYEIDELKRHMSNNASDHEIHIKLLNDRMDVLKKEKLDLETRLFNTSCDRDQTVKGLKLELVQSKKAAEEEQRKLQTLLDTQKATLNAQHQKATKELRSAAEDLKQAFVAREHFKGLRDRDITGKFTRLATEVEDISTLEWDNGDTGNWPLSESQMLQIHSSNIRLLKQQIVQSSIWSLLYNHIMQTPFKILGVEGQEADEPWVDIWDSGKLPGSLERVC